MSHPLQHVVELATTDDLETLVDIYFDAFSSDDLSRIFPDDGAGREYQTQGWKKFLERDVSLKQECRIFVIRGDNGKVQSAALLWIVRPGDGGIEDASERWPAILDGLDQHAVRSFFDGRAKHHCAIMGTREYVFLEIIMTHSTARRRGHASVLLRKVTKLADELGYEAYLNANKNAMGLYSRHGFVYRDDVKGMSALCPMVRKTERYDEEDVSLEGR